jgi:flagellin-like hook-associated protein FlgL
MDVYELPSGTKYKLEASITESPADSDDYESYDNFGVFSYKYTCEATLTGYTVDVNGNEELAEDPEPGMDAVPFTAIQKLQGGGAAPNFTAPGAWSELDEETLFDQTNMVYDNSAAYASLSQLALQQLADMRAQNGAEMSRVNFAQDLLNINAVNLEAANSRIIDVDVAAESSQLARFQILQQAGTAMLAQANTSQQSLVRLLQG